MAHTRLVAVDASDEVTAIFEGVVARHGGRSLLRRLHRLAPDKVSWPLVRSVAASPEVTCFLALLDERGGLRARTSPVADELRLLTAGGLLDRLELGDPPMRLLRILLGGSAAEGVALAIANSPDRRGTLLRGLQGPAMDGAAWQVVSGEDTGDVQHAFTVAVADYVLDAARTGRFVYEQPDVLQLL